MKMIKDCIIKCNIRFAGIEHYSITIKNDGSDFPLEIF